MPIETTCFDSVPDLRSSNVRYPLNKALFIALCAVISGAENCTDMALITRSKANFLRRFLSLPHGAPSHDTFSRFFGIWIHRLFMMAHEVDTTVATDSGHERIETRLATVIMELDWLQEGHQWSGLGAVGRITRRRELANKTTQATAYYLLSEAMSPARMIEVTRQRWAIVNSLH